MQASPWQVLNIKKKLKSIKNISFIEGMKLLHKLRSMGLNKKMIIATEITRTLVWISNRTKDADDNDDKKKFNKMARFLIKQYKVVLGLIEKKEEAQ